MRRAVLVLAMVVVAACSSGKAAGPTLRVALTGPTTVQGFRDTIGGQAVYRCDVTVTATASGGTTGDEATWTHGRDYFKHQDGTSTSHVLTAAQVAALLDGFTGVQTGTYVWGNDYFYTQIGEPFVLDLFVDYSTSDGSSDSASYSFSCQ